MATVVAPAPRAPSLLDSIWKGHLFPFDKEIQPSSIAACCRPSSSGVAVMNALGNAYIVTGGQRLH
jgi:hypothetical protein